MGARGFAARSKRPNLRTENTLRWRVIVPRHTLLTSIINHETQLTVVIPLTLYPTLRTTLPTVQPVEWVELTLLFREHDLSYADKKLVPMFSPAELLPGGTRHNSQVSRMHFAVIDLDKHDANKVAALLDALRARDLSFLFYTTWSHAEKVAAGKVGGRLLMPFDSPVEAWDWERVWKRLDADTAHLGDPQCKDPSRAYFIPAAPADAPVEPFVDIHHGKPWPVYGDGVTHTITEKSNRISVRDIQGIIERHKAARDPYKKWVRDTLRTLLAGDSIASEGERDSVVWKLACAVLDEYPNADPTKLAAIFAPSLQAMALEAPGAPTIANLEDKIRRKQQQNDEDIIAAELESDDERKRMIRAAFDDNVREHPYTRSELESFAATLGVPLRDLRQYWIVQKHTSYYVLCAGRYLGPFTTPELQKACQQYLAPAYSAGVEPYYTNSRGERVMKEPETLMLDYGTLASVVHVDMTAQVSHFDRLKRTMVEAPCPLRVHEPEYSPEVAQWLDLLGGDQAQKLRDWLAVVVRVDEPCAALYFEGQRGVGKSLFAEGVARLWSDKGTIALDSAMGSFNSATIECPVIFADEAVPKDFRGNTRTGELRALIQARTRLINRKFVPEFTLKGCVRLILAANNADLIKTNEQLTVNDIEAIVDRIVHIDCTGANGRAAREYLNQLPKRTVTDFVNADVIARHALWLKANHTPDTQHRFLVSGNATKFSKQLTVSSGLRSSVCNWLVAYLLEPHKVDHDNTLLVRVLQGSLLVNVQSVSRHWTRYETNEQPPPTGALAKALAGVSLTGAKRQLTDGRGAKTWYHEIDPENLIAWAEESSYATRETILAALKKDTVPKRPAKER